MKRRIRQARLLWHTIRYLKPIQIGGRLWFHLRRPQPDLRTPPFRRHSRGEWAMPARRLQSQTGPESFRFLNQDGDLSTGWDNPDFDRLWRYNLHYFDDLNAEGAQERTQWHIALIHRWLDENPPAGGSGWEPYPVSLRIVNWIKWALSGNELSPQAVHSLAVQARWLTQRLEYHLLGNHLFANAKALVFAGCFFEGAEAEDWLSRGLAILARQVPEQILADGGQFELSTMYHALALEDMLDLVNVMRSAGLAAPPAWEDRIATMRDWLVAMCHPDGEISFFNDAAIGIAPSPGELERYAIRLGFSAHAGIADGCTWLKDSGYIRLQNERAVVLIDVARVGPDYLPGHAHADTLSFELSVDGRRIIVNSGTSVYGTGAERLRQRGTAAHNTVVVAGENSSEVWSGFRVARRARPFDLDVRENVVSCSHDGYKRFKGGPVHRRTWRLEADKLVVEDHVSGPCGSAAYFHFHPDIRLDMVAGGIMQSQGPLSSAGLSWHAMLGDAYLDNGTWNPQFNVSFSSAMLVVRALNGANRVMFRWQSPS